MYGTQVQQEAGLLIGVDANGAVVTDADNVPAKPEPLPVKRPRGRPRKYPKSVSNFCFYFCFGGILFLLLAFINIGFFYILLRFKNVLFSLSVMRQ